MSQLEKAVSCVACSTCCQNMKRQVEALVFCKRPKKEWAQNIEPFYARRCSLASRRTRRRIQRKLVPPAFALGLVQIKEMANATLSLQTKQSRRHQVGLLKPLPQCASFHSLSLSHRVERVLTSSCEFFLLAGESLFFRNSCAENLRTRIRCGCCAQVSLIAHSSVIAQLTLCARRRARQHYAYGARLGFYFLAKTLLAIYRLARQLARASLVCAPKCSHESSRSGLSSSSQLVRRLFCLCELPL